MIIKEYYKGKNSEEHQVFADNGTHIGTILKTKNTKTETYPWQALKGCLLIGSFFEKDGKQRAANALLTHYEGM